MKIDQQLEVILEFYKQVASRCGLNDDDLSQVLQIDLLPPVDLEGSTTDLRFSLADEHEAKLGCTSTNAFRVVGDNQRNKTTCLLGIATFLGYPWHDAHVTRFLNDEEIVRKAWHLSESMGLVRQEGALHLSRGKKSLEVQLGGNTLQVTTLAGGEKATKEFRLPEQWMPFREHMESLVDVQLVSKGRRFIEQVESDVFDAMARIGEELDRNAGVLLGQLSREPKASGSAAAVALSSEDLAGTRASLQQSEGYRKRYLRERTAFFAIYEALDRLSPADMATLERLHRLNRKLAAKQKAQQRHKGLQQQLATQEQRLVGLRRDHQAAVKQKEVIDQGLSDFEHQLTRSVQERRIALATEVNDAYAFVERHDLSGVRSLQNPYLTPTSLDVYRTLISALTPYASSNVLVRLPGQPEAVPVPNLIANLRDQLGQSSVAVTLSQLATQFTSAVSSEGISPDLTEQDYDDLMRNIATFEEAIQISEGRLAELREALTLDTEQGDLSVEEQISTATAQLSKDAQQTLALISDTLESLDEPEEIELDSLWSANGPIYIQGKIDEWDRMLSSLREKMEPLRQRIVLHDQTSRAATSSTDPNASRKDALDKLQDVLARIIRLTTSHRADDGTAAVFVEAMRGLENVGYGPVVQQTMDRLLTLRCQHYYSNDVEGCQLVPLQEVIYERQNREPATFVLSDGTAILRPELSGGTESVMTVRSLASHVSRKPFGTVVLVDEWGDVQQLGDCLYHELSQMTGVLAAVFVEVVKGRELTLETIN